MHFPTLQSARLPASKRGQLLGHMALWTAQETPLGWLNAQSVPRKVLPYFLLVTAKIIRFMENYNKKRISNFLLETNDQLDKQSDESS